MAPLAPLALSKGAEYFHRVTRYALTSHFPDVISRDIFVMNGLRCILSFASTSTLSPVGRGWYQPDPQVGASVGMTTTDTADEVPADFFFRALIILGIAGVAAVLQESRLIGFEPPHFRGIFLG